MMNIEINFVREFSLFKYQTDSEQYNNANIKQINKLYSFWFKLKIKPKIKNIRQVKPVKKYSYVFSLIIWSLFRISKTKLLITKTSITQQIAIKRLFINLNTILTSLNVYESIKLFRITYKWGKQMNWIEVGQVSYKTIVCYFFLLVVLKLMGKREIGKISTFDIVVFFVISELFSLSLNEPEHSILRSIIPVTIIVVLQIATAFASLKFSKIRKGMEGESTYIIYKGKIIQEEMKRQRYTVEDLMMQLRSKDIQTPLEVEFAILETNGTLSIIKKDDCLVVSPDPLIMDGKINKTTLKRIGKEEEWLLEELQKKNLKTKDVFFALILKSGLYILPFEKSGNINKIK